MYVENTYTAFSKSAAQCGQRNVRIWCLTFDGYAFLSNLSRELARESSRVYGVVESEIVEDCRKIAGHVIITSSSDILVLRR